MNLINLMLSNLCFYSLLVIVEPIANTFFSKSIIIIIIIMINTYIRKMPCITKQVFFIVVIFVRRKIAGGCREARIISLPHTLAKYK